MRLLCHPIGPRCTPRCALRVSCARSARARCTQRAFARLMMDDFERVQARACEMERVHTCMITMMQRRSARKGVARRWRGEENRRCGRGGPCCCSTCTDAQGDPASAVEVCAAVAGLGRGVLFEGEQQARPVCAVGRRRLLGQLCAERLVAVASGSPDFRWSCTLSEPHACSMDPEF